MSYRHAPPGDGRHLLSRHQHDVDSRERGVLNALPFRLSLVVAFQLIPTGSRIRALSSPLSAAVALFKLGAQGAIAPKYVIFTNDDTPAGVARRGVVVLALCLVACYATSLPWRSIGRIFPIVLPWLSSAGCRFTPRSETRPARWGRWRVHDRRSGQTTAERCRNSWSSPGCRGRY